VSRYERQSFSWFRQSGGEGEPRGCSKQSKELRGLRCQYDVCDWVARGFVVFLQKSLRIL